MAVVKIDLVRKEKNIFLDSDTYHDDDDGYGSKSSGSNMTSGDAGTRCVAPIILSNF